MSARILVVDDLPANVKMLEARLSAEYFSVLTASSGPEALAICGQGQCDIVLLDVMMPGMDGFETCRRLKADPATAHLPVVIVTALDQPADRVRGLEAGADDFLLKPVDEIALIARVRSLARLKTSIDELRNRALTAAGLGAEIDLLAKLDAGEAGRVLLVDDRGSSVERVTSALAKRHKIEVERNPDEAIFKAAEADYDLAIVSLALANYDALRLCGQLRSLERTRRLPILLLAEDGDRPRVLRGLELGVNDWIARPIDRNELIARVRTQIRRRRYTDALSETLQASLAMATTDSLTGLHNRRYLDSHLAAMMGKAVSRNAPLSLMVLDIDHFKAINDRFGHEAGDEVLRAFAERVKGVVRGVNLMCRMGGEEFVIAMPDTRIEIAQRIAERVRAVVEGEGFPIEGGRRVIPVTVSIGLADRGRETQAERVLRRADKALYRSKAAGRNRVTADAA